MQARAAQGADVLRRGVREQCACFEHERRHDALILEERRGKISMPRSGGVTPAGTAGEGRGPAPIRREALLPDEAAKAQLGGSRISSLTSLSSARRATIVDTHPYGWTGAPKLS